MKIEINCLLQLQKYGELFFQSENEIIIILNKKISQSKLYHLLTENFDFFELENTYQNFYLVTFTEITEKLINNINFNNN